MSCSGSNAKLNVILPSNCIIKNTDVADVWNLRTTINYKRNRFIRNIRTPKFIIVIIVPICCIIHTNQKVVYSIVFKRGIKTESKPTRFGSSEISIINQCGGVKGNNIATIYKLTFCGMHHIHQNPRHREWRCIIIIETDR